MVADVAPSSHRYKSSHKNVTAGLSKNNLHLPDVTSYWNNNGQELGRYKIMAQYYVPVLVYRMNDTIDYVPWEIGKIKPKAPFLLGPWRIPLKNVKMCFPRYIANCTALEL